MLGRDLDLADVDARHWANGWRLLVPPRWWDRPRWALVIVQPAAEGGAAPVVERVIIAGAGGEGRLEAPPPLAGTSSRDLAALARALDVAAVVVVATDVVAALSADLERRLRFDQDGVEQGLLVLAALRRVAGRGVWTEPALLDLLPAPGFDGLQRTFDLLVPDATTLVGYVFDDDQRAVHTSIIAEKRRGHLVRVATHRAIADLVDERALAARWASRTGDVVDAVTQRIARPSIAVFAEHGAVQRIVTGPPDQLGRELSARRVIIDPAPAWLLGLLGGATVAAVAARGARALAGLLPSATRDRASALAGRAQAALERSGAHPFALLGFDPLELWARLRYLYRA
ncbi:MAG: hypothetical protein KBG28_08150 [Kofleriaceae bacterium]|jgi:hypothetical protein|nr:hypothetical protein [Kofleriaceae bacterium]MBP6835977.1 hypothetical protein [Kofleriaceae bacterium]MBP9203916.1 hypothetical protein [Kofleriaceae bacterium]